MQSSISNNLSGTSISGYSAQQSRQIADHSEALSKKETSVSSVFEEQSHDVSLEEQEKLQYLKARDQEVKVHEQAHLSAAGSLAIGGASFSYQKGPDGGRYAVGGEVNIDTSAIPGDSAATLQKAETIRRAAMAPANPSSQDRKVASQASAMANKARAELFQENQKLSENNEEQSNMSNTISIAV